MVRPKKHLGQHFLTDPAIARRIVDAVNWEAEGLVIEVGPGTGILTGLLLQQNRPFIPVEIDRESALFLKQKWPVLAGSLVEGDFLKIDLETMTPGQIILIGNFPYHISSQILFRVLQYRHKVSSVVCMVQKEVAERIAASPGSRTYGILSVLLQAYFRINYLFSVKPGSFFPPPKVTSGVIRLERNETMLLPCNEGLFFRVVKTVFNQRRKMIRNSIRSMLTDLDGPVDLLAKRPEQLDVQQFIDLTLWVESRQEDAGNRTA